ncbi:MAG: hypothetical protein SNJ76_12090 [Fimbriimonadaceae bacterium]
MNALPSGTVAASAVFDAFGVLRHGTGALASAAVREAYGSDDLDGLKTFLAGRGVRATATPAGRHLPVPAESDRAASRPGPIRRLWDGWRGLPPGVRGVIGVDVGGRLVCLAMLADVARRVEGRGSMIDCPKLCRATEFWHDAVREGNVFSGMVSLWACDPVIEAIREVCKCR